MLNKLYNMGKADRIFRSVFGISLIYLAFFMPSIVNNSLLNIIVGLFGLMNVVSSIFRICPAYLLVSFSTNGTASEKIMPAVDPVSLDGTYKIKAVSLLRMKLLLSVVIPMFMLLMIFSSMLLDKAYELELSAVSKSADVASEEAIAHLTSQASEEVKDNLPEAEKTALIVVQAGVKDAELFYYHDSSGKTVGSIFDKGVNQSELLHAVTELHHSGESLENNKFRGVLTINQKDYVWSTINAGQPDRWFTSITPCAGDHSLHSQLLTPELIVIFMAMIILSIWASAYIIKKFLVSIESGAKQLQKQALQDPLTGLPNRLSIEGVIANRLATLDDKTESIALLLVDIIDFRDINDTLGFELGDKLQIEIGKNLSEIESENVDVISMGADVFCLVYKTDQNRLSASRLSNEVHDKLERSHYLDGVPVAIQVRIGVSFYPTDAATVPELIRCADIALAEAKSLRLNDCYFQHELDTHSIRKLTLLARLRTAIEEDELTLVYQPKVDIQNNSLVGVEVLVRWHDEQYGSVSPVEFVNWAEKSGLIDKLTRWVLTTAEKQCREWRDRGYVVPFSVNLSPTNLYDGELIPLVTRLINKGSFGNGMLELEITENAVMEDPERALQTMNMLSKLGVSFAIDDFGTGMSSFTYLRKFPVDNLKIDRAFIQDVDASDKDAILLKSMIQLGHGLGCVVTAEGVEEQESMDKLKAFNCDHVQGFLVCKPLPADQFTKWMDTSGWLGIRCAA